MKLLLLGLASWCAFSAQTRAQEGDSQIQKEIALRRAFLGKLEFSAGERPRLPAAQQKELDQKIELALEQFQAALASPHTRVFAEAVSDLLNGQYRNFPDEKVLA